jgi:hypothetical protein
MSCGAYPSGPADAFAAILPDSRAFLRDEIVRMNVKNAMSGIEYVGKVQSILDE